MSAVQRLLTEHIDIWSAADTERKSGRGRASGIAGSVYGVKRLRELILELAVRGKLVPQEPNDGPAVALLKRIEAERAQLAKSGAIKAEKSFPKIDRTEVPFELPSSWMWVRLSQIGHDWGQTTPETQFTYIEVSAIDGRLGTVSSPEVVDASAAPSRARKVVRSGTVIYSTVRPYLLNVAVVDREFTPEPIASTAFAVVHPFCDMPPRYLLSYLRSPVFVRYVESVQTGIAYPAINDRQFFSGLMPLPPLSEQHRIVAKVDELMGLCDKLEAQHSDAAEAHEKLVKYLLGTLTSSQNTEDFASNWQRIATHFDTLFSTETSVDALKQTVLQLAVMGKLVQQDANDEPASEMLHRIGCKTNHDNHESKLELPKNWTWALIENCFIVSGGIQKTPFRTPKSNAYPYLGVGNVYRGRLELRNVKEFELAAGELERYRLEPQDILVVEGNGSVTEIGRCALWHGEIENCVHQNHIIRCRPKDIQLTPFTELYLNSPEGVNEMTRLAITSAGLYSLSVGKIKKIAFPLPPLAEQRRIIAKVDQFMALCDGLKSQLSAANQLQQKLADVLVEQACL